MPVTNFVWDEISENVLSEVDDSGVLTAEYANEPGQFGKLMSQRRGGTDSFYHFDGQGSTRQLTSMGQMETDSYSYSAFGEQVSSSGSTTNPFRYNGAVGYYADSETGNIYVRRRTYETGIGRWMSIDPELFVDGNNLYWYVRNNPVALTDPTGESSYKCECECRYRGKQIFLMYHLSCDLTPQQAEFQCKNKCAEASRRRPDLDGFKYRCNFDSVVRDCAKTPPTTPPKNASLREVCSCGATGVMTWIRIDAATPGPSDASPHKWACYAVVGGFAFCVWWVCNKEGETDLCSWADCDIGTPCGQSGTRSCQWDKTLGGADICGCFPT